MPNLAHTQAEWTHFLGDEVGYAWLTPFRVLEDLANRFSLERVRVLNQNDATSATPHFTALDLIGANYNVNTDRRGRISARITANAGNWDVKLFKATGGAAGDEVARALNVAAGATFTLVAQNASGLTGSGTLGATIAAETNDRHYLQVLLDFKVVARNVETGASATDEDASASYEAMTAAYAEAAGLLRQAMNAFIGRFPRFGIADTNNTKARGRKFLESVDAIVFDETQTRDGDGNVSIGKDGLWNRGSQAMADELTAGEQDIVKRVPSAAAATFGSNNAGLGAIAAHTPGEGAQAMRVIGECVSGINDGALGREEFRISYVFTDKGTEVILPQAFNLRVKRNWTGELGIGSIRLNRTFTKTGDGGNAQLAAASGADAPTTEGETNTNCPDGKFYWKVVVAGAVFGFRFYKSSNRADEDEVARSPDVAVNTAFTATSQRSSGVTVTWKSGTAPTNGSVGELNLNPFKSQNAVQLRDTWEVVVTIAAAPGQYQSVFGRMFPGATLNSDVAGSESISDDYVRAGYPEYADTNQ